MKDVKDWDIEKQERIEKGIALFKQGYNCAQTVALTFADWYGVAPELMARISASFGGGIGRMRETCGTASGMFMLAGLETATAEANPEIKRKNYAEVQMLADRFRNQTGSLLCRELLGLNRVIKDPTPEERTEQYYKKRPCLKMIETAISIYTDFLREKEQERMLK